METFTLVKARRLLTLKFDLARSLATERKYGLKTENIKPLSTLKQICHETIILSSSHVICSRISKRSSENLSRDHFSLTSLLQRFRSATAENMEKLPSEKLRSASVPHIQFEYPRQPFAHFSRHVRIMQCGWRRSGKFAIICGMLVLVACLVPYTIALASGHIKPLLPLISQLGSREPDNGFFNLVLFITAIFGFITVLMRYVYVSSQNENQDWRANLLNKTGILCGVMSFVGMVVLASYPIEWTAEHKSWESTGLFPHMFGAFLMFFFGGLYLMFQMSLTIFFCDESRRLAVIRGLLFTISAICFVTSTLNTLQTLDILKPKEALPGLRMGVAAKKIEVPPNPLVSAVCEWLMVFMQAAYFFTFYSEGQKISVAITFRTLVSGRRISLASLGNISNISKI